MKKFMLMELKKIIFDRVEIANPSNSDQYYLTSADTANVRKYKGVFFDANAVNIKVWGNIVVSATPVSGQTVYKRIISSKFSDEVPQLVFETVLYEIYPNDTWIDPILYSTNLILKIFKK